MGDDENDYDAIARCIDEALAAFTGNAHEPHEKNSDSITMTKDGFITGVIRLQRLRDSVEGLAAAHRIVPSKWPEWPEWPDGHVCQRCRKWMADATGHVCGDPNS